MPSASRQPQAAATVGAGSRYMWIALSNTTLGMLMATVNSSIMLIALPDIFCGAAGTCTKSRSKPWRQVMTTWKVARVGSSA